MRAGLVAVACILAAVAGVGIADDSSSKKPDPNVAIAIADKTEVLDAAVKKQKGKIVLIDFWATWCAPCVKKFPHLVEMHRKYSPKGLVCMSVTLDDEEDKDKALTFLKEKGASFPNFLLTATSKDEEKKLEDRYGLRGSIPYMVAFNRNGEKIWDSNTKKTDAELDEFIEMELAKK